MKTNTQAQLSQHVQFINDDRVRDLPENRVKCTIAMTDISGGPFLEPTEEIIMYMLWTRKRCGETKISLIRTSHQLRGV